MSHSMGDDEDALIVAALVAFDASAPPSAARAMLVDRVLARLASPELPCALARVAARYEVSVAPAWAHLRAHGARPLPCEGGERGDVREGREGAEVERGPTAARHAQGVCETCPKRQPPPTLRP